MQKSGIDILGDIAWGTHFCLFYENTPDLVETLAAYCKAGLLNHEFCLWIVAAPVTEDDARQALRSIVPDLDRYLTEGAIELLTARDWYLPNGEFEGERALRACGETIARGLAKGYAAVRVTGDTSWLEPHQWRDFCDYEHLVNDAVANARAAVLCTYPLATCGAHEVLDVMRTHQFAIARCGARWQVIETMGSAQAKAEVLKRQREEALLAEENHLLELVAKGSSQPQILDGLCRLVERHSSGVLASILLFDGARLRHGGAPSLPTSYTDAVDGSTVGPRAGSCGTAAHFGRQIIVEDIATDPLWADYRGLALPYGLRACWSTPVFSSQGQVIATFAMYYREPRSPSEHDQKLIARFTHLAGVAIERKLTQDKLRRSESYLLESQRLSHTGSFARKVSGEGLYWSEEMFRLFGFDPQEVPPNREVAWERIHPDDYQRVVDAFEQAFREKTDLSLDHRIVQRDGTMKHVHTIAHPIFDESGAPVEYVGTVVDLTEQKRAEEEREKLRLLEAELARGTRLTMMGELTASLAHEVNQPITAAITDANTCVRWLTRAEPRLEEACAAAKETVQNATRAAEIISRMRRLFEKDGPEYDAVDVNALIDEMATLVSGEAGRHGVSIRTELASGLSPVLADRVQLQQVLLNLLMNSIEATRDLADPRQITLTSVRYRHDQMAVSVADTGIGLPATNVDDLFNAFVTTKPGGTGMGLAISRSIIEVHGGRLWATSNAERGATFSFTLPIWVAE
jgi:PAS domain S-box-containing protein